MSLLWCVSMRPKLPMCCWFSRLWTFFGPCSEVESNTGGCRGGGGSRGHRRQLVWRPRLATTAPLHHHHHTCATNMEHASPPQPRSTLACVANAWKRADSVWRPQSPESRRELSHIALCRQTVRSQITFTLQDILLNPLWSMKHPEAAKQQTVKHSYIYPTPRNALFVRWFVRDVFTPSNALAHQSNEWACALDFWEKTTTIKYI